jgi:hypothetical protein
MEAMPLHVRVWDCPICDTQHDRDLNAARNILKQATAGTAGSYADGVQVRPGARLQAGTQQSEAQQLVLMLADSNPDLLFNNIPLSRQIELM